MSPEERFVGVARPPQGLDPEPPRRVVNLAKPRAPDDGGVPIASPDPPSVGPLPYMERPTAVVPVPPDGDRPPHYARTAEHRRRFRRAVLRRFEVAVWVSAVAVAITMVVLLITGIHPAATRAGWQTALASKPPPPSSNTTERCIFEPCAEPALTGEPTLVRIPSIQVESTLESLVRDATGKLEAPKTYEHAGWWRDGVVPGDTGPAVIAGHVDSAKGPAIFFKLRDLRPGDLIEVERGGRVVTFSVTTTEQYPKDTFPTDRVYQPTPDAELRLITCGGAFDQNRQSYRDNIVVYAILA